MEEAEKELDKIKIIRINKFLNRITMKKTIFNTLNQNTKKDLNLGKKVKSFSSKQEITSPISGYDNMSCLVIIK